MLKKNQTPEHIEKIQVEFIRIFKGFHNVLDDIKVALKQNLKNIDEDSLKELQKVGYQKELQMCLEMQKELKSIYLYTENETKTMKQLLKSAK